MSALVGRLCRLWYQGTPLSMYHLSVGVQRVCPMHKEWLRQFSMVRVEQARILSPVSCLQAAPARNLSKRSKDKKKEKKDKGKKGGKAASKGSMSLSPTELQEVIDFAGMKDQFAKTVDHLKLEYIQQLSLRTSAGVFNSLSVSTDDGNFPLNQLGQIVQKSPQLLAINMAAVPQYIPAVKDAITKSGMNVNPQQDGTTLFVPLPKVTIEHREQLAKSAKMLADKTKEKLRDIQHKYLRELKKAKAEHSEDLVFNTQSMVEGAFHDLCTEVDKLKDAKQKELLGVK